MAAHCEHTGAIAIQHSLSMAIRSVRLKGVSFLSLMLTSILYVPSLHPLVKADSAASLTQESFIFGTIILQGPQWIHLFMKSKIKWIYCSDVKQQQ